MSSVRVTSPPRPHAYDSAEPSVGDVVRVRGRDWLVVDVGDDRLVLRRVVPGAQAPHSEPTQDELDAREVASTSQRRRDRRDYGLGDSAAQPDQ